MVLLVSLDRNKWKWIQLIWNIRNIVLSVIAGYVVEVMTASCLKKSTVMVKNNLYSYQQISMEVHHFNMIEIFIICLFQILGTMNLQYIKRVFCGLIIAYQILLCKLMNQSKICKCACTAFILNVFVWIADDLPLSWQFNIS